MYGLEFLNQCGKRVKTKSQKVFWANIYACTSYGGKTDRGGFSPNLSREEDSPNNLQSTYSPQV